MKLKSDRARALIFLLIMLSPVGGPLVGVLFGSCPTDPLQEPPDGMLAMSYSYCGFSRPVERFYQDMFSFPFFPMWVAGPVIGGALTGGWWIAALTSFVQLVRYLWRAIASVVVEKIEKL
jgi:hypothetical protein